jgi:D-alanyl-D-alanine carboxypeptidase
MSSPLIRFVRSRAVVATVALAAGLSVALGQAAAPVALAKGTLPGCRYDDILTGPRDYEDWSTTLVDTILRVPSTYVPPDLVSTALAGLGGGGTVRKVAIDDLQDMAGAASANDTPIAVQSGYRSYSQQKTTFNYWVSVDGYTSALKVSARPGHSEHQLGLAIDFKSQDGGPPWEGGDWALSPAGSWLATHAWTFGWVMSYPKNGYAKDCYGYEPWHYRYVGREMAERIHDSKLTVREYLWANFTTAVVPPKASGGGGSDAPGGSSTPSASLVASAPPLATLTPTEDPTLAPTIEPAGTPTAPGVSPDPLASATPASSTSTFGDAGPAVIAMVVVALVALVGGWWIVRRNARSRRRRTR